ncbi:hypothetical protein DDB_G0290295 [Dictyostelium discoideum AX4]|uniref:Uncharacterized protein n=1 Tax=Dictyostelium discoideum TaxID=44689 RepID=Q54G99_DICDI|nr:hypothetical protein DDB_G0290295 [Dictyostelium discoideum AX4]EAL62274.1 hypothetical protein DDB_G0290295 [Dictyostelium discoideum AX4]|eukprot:XP_635784.1 hypothetical protein DDB_G0290295 [Dictyostelium discoideum AX4]
MSCPFKHLYSQGATAGNNSNSSSNNNSPYTSNEFTPISSNVAISETEETVNNWGCQVVRDGGLDFFIKTDKFLECKVQEEGEEIAVQPVCPFRSKFKDNNSNSADISIPVGHPPIRDTTTTTTTPKDNLVIDKDGYFIVPLVNMPPFLTFKELKDILLSMDIRLKDLENDTWEHLNFYYELDSTPSELQLINDTTQLHEIIKIKNQTIYLK